MDTGGSLEDLLEVIDDLEMNNERKSRKFVLVAQHDDDGLVWFGLVSLFNGISTFVGYIIPKPSFLKNSCGTI